MVAPRPDRPQPRQYWRTWTSAFAPLGATAGQPSRGPSAKA